MAISKSVVINYVSKKELIDKTINLKDEDD